MQIDTEWKYYVSQKMIAKWRQKWSGVTQDLAGEGDKYQSPPKIGREKGHSIPASFRLATTW